MTTITEIAPDLFRLSTFVPQAGIQFNQFLLRDDEPLLFHTGLRQLFPAVHEAVARLLDPATIRWISFSHFEADESGSLNEWLALAPNAETAVSVQSAAVNVNDFALRPAHILGDNDVLSTGRYRLRFLQTPHVPHGWDAAVLFEETNGTLLCSDLFHQMGDVEPLTHNDVIDRARATLLGYQGGPFSDYQPFTSHTRATLERLATLNPRALATMHGSTFVGNGAQALHDLANVMREPFAETEGALQVARV